MQSIQRGLLGFRLHSSSGVLPLYPPCALFTLRVTSHRRASSVFVGCGLPFSYPTSKNLSVWGLTPRKIHFSESAGSYGCRRSDWRLHHCKYYTLSLELFVLALLSFLSYGFGQTRHFDSLAFIPTPTLWVRCGASAVSAKRLVRCLPLRQWVQPGPRVGLQVLFSGLR